MNDMIASEINQSDMTADELKKFDKLMQRTADVFHNQIPFHQVIGFTFDELAAHQCKISFKKKPELVGNPFHNILHGGVTATALDVVGGCMAIAGMIAKNLNITDDAIAQKMTKTSTIDLRTDFIRPGKGEHFYAIARLLRSGNKVAVVRMELHDEDDTVIALGTGTYMTG